MMLLSSAKERQRDGDREGARALFGVFIVTIIVIVIIIIIVKDTARCTDRSRVLKTYRKIPKLRPRLEVFSSK